MGYLVFRQEDQVLFQGVVLVKGTITVMKVFLKVLSLRQEDPRVMYPGEVIKS
jgi:hypothetical protein